MVEGAAGRGRLVDLVDTLHVGERDGVDDGALANSCEEEDVFVPDHPTCLPQPGAREWSYKKRENGRR